VLNLLAEEGVLHRRNGRYTWIGDGYPAGRLSLRTSTPDNVVIQDVSADPPQVIGQMDCPSAPVLIHEGAVYLHGGATYVVEALDWEEGIARVRAAEPDYYTRASSVIDVRIVKEYSPCHPVTLSPDLEDKTRRQGDTVKGAGGRCAVAAILMVF